MATAVPTRTHRAFCVFRPAGRRAAGRWQESGYAFDADDGNGGVRIILESLPTSGFDGNILLRPIDSKPDAPLPDLDEGDEEEILD